MSTKESRRGGKNHQTESGIKNKHEKITNPEEKSHEFSRPGRTKETRWHNKVHTVVGCRGSLTLSPHRVTGRRFTRPTILAPTAYPYISPTLFNVSFGYWRAELIKYSPSLPLSFHWVHDDCAHNSSYLTNNTENRSISFEASTIRENAHFSDWDRGRNSC